MPALLRWPIVSNIHTRTFVQTCKGDTHTHTHTGPRRTNVAETAMAVSLAPLPTSLSSSSKFERWIEEGLRVIPLRVRVIPFQRAFSLSKTIWDTGVDNTAEEKQLGVGHTERIREHTAIVSLPTWMLILNTNTRNKPSCPSLPPISLGRIVSFFAPPLPRSFLFFPPLLSFSTHDFRASVRVSTPINR